MKKLVFSIFIFRINKLCKFYDFLLNFPSFIILEPLWLNFHITMGQKFKILKKPLQIQIFFKKNFIFFCLRTTSLYSANFSVKKLQIPLNNPNRNHQAAGQTIGLSRVFMFQQNWRLLENPLIQENTC